MSKDLWDGLEAFFPNNKMSRMLELKKRLFITPKISSLSITDYKHLVKNIVDDLNGVNSYIDDATCCVNSW